MLDKAQLKLNQKLATSQFDTGLNPVHRPATTIKEVKFIESSLKKLCKSSNVKTFYRELQHQKEKAEPVNDFGKIPLTVKSIRSIRGEVL